MKDCPVRLAIASLALLMNTCTSPVPAQAPPPSRTLPLYHPVPQVHRAAPNVRRRDDAEIRERLREIGQEVRDAQRQLDRGPAGQ